MSRQTRLMLLSKRESIISPTLYASNVSVKVEITNVTVVKLAAKSAGDVVTFDVKAKLDERERKSQLITLGFRMQLLRVVVFMRSLRVSNKIILPIVTTDRFKPHSVLAQRFCKDGHQHYKTLNTPVTRNRNTLTMATLVFNATTHHSSQRSESSPSKYSSLTP